MGKSAKAGVAVVLAVVTRLGGFLVETQTRLIRRTYDEYMLDNRNHYLSCEELPTEEVADKVVQEHQETVQLIEQVNPGLEGIDIDTTTCPGKADLVMWYASHQDSNKEHYRRRNVLWIAL
jgi:hypothetical protein